MHYGYSAVLGKGKSAHFSQYLDNDKAGGPQAMIW